MPPQTVFSPAKLNLFLAITGRRTDGFHDLVSVVATVDFGDELDVQVDESGRFELSCDVPQVPTGESNLIVRAARAFAARAGWKGGAQIALRKVTPMGAGLGGGSSNAAATLLALNRMTGAGLDLAALQEVAAELGSDCPLFLTGGPVVMRGRGEVVQALPPSAAARLVGRRVLVFKPAFSIETAWAYRELAAAATTGTPAYLPAPEAEARLSQWLESATAPSEALLFNNLERSAFSKFVALPTLLERLRVEHGWHARMSGSGSACFGFLHESQAVEPLLATIREAWGETGFTRICRIRPQMELNPS